MDLRQVASSQVPSLLGEIHEIRRHIEHSMDSRKYLYCFVDPQFQKIDETSTISVCG